MSITKNHESHYVGVLDNPHSQKKLSSSGRVKKMSSDCPILRNNEIHDSL